jgi:AcrR family transcriptional regulator
MSKRLESVVGKPRPTTPRVGRPRRGTEAARSDCLIAAATRVFLRDGYGAASIDKVAREAGISTRTIYGRFRNKADLLVSVITRLVERDMATVFVTIGETIAGRACDPEAAALFRIVSAEARRFPALAEKMRANTKTRVLNAIATYFRGQIQKGNLSLADPERSARLFIQMVCAELHECLLFGSPEEISKLDFAAHVDLVVRIFLTGAAPRRSTRGKG